MGVNRLVRAQVTLGLDRHLWLWNPARPRDFSFSFALQPTDGEVTFAPANTLTLGRKKRPKAPSLFGFWTWYTGAASSQNRQAASRSPDCTGPYFEHVLG